MADWHEYPTNFSNGTSISGVGDLFGTYPAHIVENFGIGLSVILWLVLFALFYYSGTRKAMMASSFITGVLSVYLWRVDLIPAWVIFVCAILTVFGAIGSKSESI